MADYDVRPLTLQNLGDFRTVFSGDLCENCQCTYFFHADEDISWSSISLEKTRLWRGEILEGGSDGYLLYRDGEPVGWCQCLSPERLPWLTGQLGIDDPAEARIITCLFLTKASRKQGLSRVLVGAVLDAERELGTRKLYAIPASETMLTWALPSMRTTAYSPSGVTETSRELGSLIGFSVTGMSRITRGSAARSMTLTPGAVTANARLASSVMNIRVGR